MRLRLVVGLVLVHGFAFAAPDKQEPDTLRGPLPETSSAGAPISLPPIPSFELDTLEGDLVHPQYLRVRGKKHLDSEVKVQGYIVWIYDCIVDNKRAKETRAQTQRRIDADPTLCERPKFYLGSRRDTRAEQALWVVDVPRPPNKLEKERLPKQELAAWPRVPKLKLGDYVVVTGKFAVASPHNEHNSDGLVVFESMQRAKRPRAGKRKRATTASPAAPAAVAPVPATAPARTVPAPLRKVVDRKIRNDSMTQSFAATKAMGRKQFVDAVKGYRKAVATWADNHVAWYGLGGAHAHGGDWKAARGAFETAAKLRPDVAMYAMWSGIAAYEAQVAAAREAQAAKAGVKPSDISVDRSAIVFDAARAHFEHAIAIEPTLWRAHYFVGRIHRDGDRAKQAAESFTQAALHGRKQQAPYVALGELYRKWDYTQEAIAVTTVGTQELDPSPDRSDVFYVLAMAYEDRHAHAKALEAFTRALEYKPDNYKALFQRGQVYLHMRKREDAKRDLEAFVGSPAATSLVFANQIAKKQLLEIAAGSR